MTSTQRTGFLKTHEMLALSGLTDVVGFLLSQKAGNDGQWDRACFYLEQGIQNATTEASEWYARLQYAERLCRYGRPSDALMQVEKCVIPSTNRRLAIHKDIIRGVAVEKLGVRSEALALYHTTQNQLLQTPCPGLTNLHDDLKQALYPKVS